MCRKLRVSRNLVYYKKKGRKIDSELENAVIEIFRKSRNNYGSRKIKIELKKEYHSFTQENTPYYGQIWSGIKLYDQAVQGS